MKMDLETRIALIDPKRRQHSVWVTPLPKTITPDKIKVLIICYLAHEFIPLFLHRKCFMNAIAPR